MLAAGAQERQAHRHLRTPWRARSRPAPTASPPACPTWTPRRSAEHQVRARIVVLAASCCESARLLLNSKSPRFSEWPRQLQRRRRQVPHRLDRPERQRAHSRADGLAALQLGRRRRHAPVRAVVGRQQGARIPARVPHRARRRIRHAGLRVHAAASRTIRSSRGGGYGAELKAEYRRYYGAFVELRRARRTGRARGLLLRDRSRRRRQVGHSGAALPSHVERSRAPAGAAHAGDLPRHHQGDGRRADVGDARTRSRTTGWRSAA